jgi:uncharacterized protein (DUF305 family)
MNVNTLRRILLPGAAIVLALVLAACGGSSGDTAGAAGTDPQPSTEASPTAETGSDAEFNEADVSFAQNMIVHHEQAVQMSQLAETRAEDPEIVELAAQIMAAQEPEIVTMTGWLTAWSQPVEPAGGHDGHAMAGMMSEAEMSALEAADGVDFDRMYAQMMIAHHNGAIEMAREVQNDGVNTDVKALAATIEQTQAAEVAVLQGIVDRL